jgi:Cell wall binding domain 2 (CWB2)
MGDPRLRLLAVLAVGAVVGGCGKTAPSRHLLAGAPVTPPPGEQGAVSVATKNTTRLGGADPASDAAGVARAVYPGLTAATRPQAVVLVNQRRWPDSIAASSLAAGPLRAPLLFADGDGLPEATAQALVALHPVGDATLGGAQVIRIATTAAVPDGYRTRTLPGTGDPAGDAASIAGVVAALGGRPDRVIVLSADSPRALQMPAAGLAAESGAPILFVTSSGVPAATAGVLRSLHRPTIYLVGAAAVTRVALGELAHLGRVVRVAGAAGEASPASAESINPVDNAIAVSRFSDGSFGWGIHEAGHGLVFANAARSLDAPAAAPLSAHGDYGPLLLLDGRESVPPALARYLSDIEPGYTQAVPPVREVYNHGWLIGDELAISALAQAEIDAILEIAPRQPAAAEPPPPLSE